MVERRQSDLSLATLVAATGAVPEPILGPILHQAIYIYIYIYIYI